MKKALKKQAAFVMLSAALAVQTGFPGYAATSVMGSWANEDGGWKFYGSDHQAYTGWVKTESGWYYLNPADGINLRKTPGISLKMVREVRQRVIW